MKSGSYESVVSNSMTSAPLGISEIKALKVLVYPNTAQQKVSIMLPFSGNADGSLALYTVEGRKYLEQEINQPKTELDISSLPSGMYFLKVISKEGIGTGKLLKD